jgi:hypothetical protein
MFWQGNCPFDILEQGDHVFHHSVWRVRLAKWSDRLNVPNFRKMSYRWNITQEYHSGISLRNITQEYLILSFFFPTISSFQLSGMLLSISLVHLFMFNSRRAECKSPSKVWIFILLSFLLEFIVTESNGSEQLGEIHEFLITDYLHNAYCAIVLRWRWFTELWLRRLLSWSLRNIGRRSLRCGELNKR